MSRDVLAHSLSQIALPEPAPIPLKGALWSSTLDDTNLKFQTPSLPNPIEALRLFDPATQFAETTP